MDQSQDPKHIVANGYDVVASRYTELAVHEPHQVRQHYVRMLIEALPKGASLLELGCGSGVPATKALAEHFQVTGVDISAHQIERARANVPGAVFLCEDMAALDFPPGIFDAVTAFYSIIHLPRAEHSIVFRNIAAWLKPGGLFIASMGVTSLNEYVDSDWLGAPMYWSHFDSATSQALVSGAGLEVAEANEITTDSPDGGTETSLWIVARKPPASA